MATIPRQREIIDRRKLIARLDLIAQDDSDSTAQRAAVLSLLKEAASHGRNVIRDRFQNGASGAETVRAHSFLMDQILRVLFDHAFERVYPLANPTAGERLCLSAVGGYGRGELAPHSDLDLLFIHHYKPAAHTEQVIEYVLYMLWDMGLKVGHATRSVDECMRRAQSDMTIRTSILEARYIWGDRELHDEMRHRFAAEVVTGSELAFVEAKLAERDARHQRMGDSRYVLEPNIKDGKGGLRDLHTLFWIAKYLYRVDDVKELVDRKVLTAREARDFAKAQNVLWTIRCHLHYLAGRPDDRLTFDRQPEIARLMEYSDHAGALGVERFMKRYFLIAKDVGDLTRIFCAALEAEQKRPPIFSLNRLIGRKPVIDGFPIVGGRLSVTGRRAFTDDPVNLLRLFRVAQVHDLDIHPKALQTITRNLGLIDAKLRGNEEANRLFLDMLTSPKDPETTLRRLNEAGVFGRFITDFGRVVAQMQHDMYHVYTVDEHTIRAIGILHGIATGALKADHPLSCEVIHKVVSRRALYVAVLLHDIAKGRGGDHSELGAEIAQRLCPRLGLTDEETESVAWLVLNHLKMSNTAQKRDINDRKTIADFAALVQSPERLRMLIVLTVADMRATGPQVWNGWKAALLRELYWRTEELLSGAGDAGRRARVETTLDRLREALEDWPAADFDAHVERGNDGYWLGHETDTLARHARQVREAERDGMPLSIAHFVDPARSVTEVSIYTADHPGLFARIAGAMAMTGVNIAVASICTLQNGMALDTFWIQDQDGGAVSRPERLARIAARVEQSIAGRLHPERDLAGTETLPARARVFTVPPRVLIDNNVSATHTVIEVNGRDRPGLLHAITRTIAALNLQINTAKITTYGERVVDVFYVKDVFGMKVTHDRRLAEIKARILDAISEDDDEVTTSAATAAAE